MLNKLIGREVNALFCPKCMLFKILSFGEDITNECPICHNNRDVCNIKIKRFR